MFVVFCLLLYVFRSNFQHSKNLVPISVRLFIPHNIQPIRTVTSSTTPPPPSDKKLEKKSKARQKTLKINTAISEHDLTIKVSHMCEWLEKGNHVYVFISKIGNKSQVSLEDL